MNNSTFLYVLLFSLLTAATRAQDADLINCTLCSDGSVPNDPDARADFGDEILTCQQVYDQGVLELPEANCTFLQSLGSSVCYCNREVPAPNDCTLCTDASLVPEPLRESFPGETCAEMQVTAQRDDEGNCGHYQSVVGHYCGCDNTIASSVCRLCGDGVDLPDPQLAVGDDSSSSCIEKEFEANVNSNCNAITDLYAATCCAGTPAPTPTSGGAVQHVRNVVVAATVANLALLLFVV